MKPYIVRTEPYEAGFRTVVASSTTSRRVGILDWPGNGQIVASCAQCNFSSLLFHDGDGDFLDDLWRHYLDEHTKELSE